MRGSGLRGTQFTVLQVLDRAGTLSQGDLGAFLCIDSTTLSRTLQPLVRGGWVAVRRGSDKRERLLSLTSAGERKVALVTPRWHRAQRRLKRAFAGNPAHLEQQLRQLAGALS